MSELWHGFNYNSDSRLGIHSVCVIKPHYVSPFVVSKSPINCPATTKFILNGCENGRLTTNSWYSLPFHITIMVLHQWMELGNPRFRPIKMVMNWTNEKMKETKLPFTTNKMTLLAALKLRLSIGYLGGFAALSIDVLAGWEVCVGLFVASKQSKTLRGAMCCLMIYKPQMGRLWKFGRYHKRVSNHGVDMATITKNTTKFAPWHVNQRLWDENVWTRNWDDNIWTMYGIG